MGNEIREKVREMSLGKSEMTSDSEENIDFSRVDYGDERRLSIQLQSINLGDAEMVSGVENQIRFESVCNEHAEVRDNDVSTKEDAHAKLKRRLAEKESAQHSIEIDERRLQEEKIKEEEREHNRLQHRLSEKRAKSGKLKKLDTDEDRVQR